ncbi:hypothetical protein ACLQ24_16485 [Micromonospora sp. DT4]|uniref:hypothetical protein n=1 Tax=Micromonospora sp. DT4 TaxID=3393438 RepID=UPI003CF940CF
MAVTVTAALAVTGTPASAAIGNHRVQLCAQGNYVAGIAWSTGATSYAVAPGECRTFDIVGTGPYVIGGFNNNTAARFSIKLVKPESGSFDSSTPGSAWGVRGTDKNPYWVRWQ